MLNTPLGIVRLYVLGDARIETPSSVIEPRAELAFATALYFLFERKGRVSRRALERLLWPTASPSVASHRMRQTLLKLRKIGLPVERDGASRLVLRGVQVVVDSDCLSTTSGADWLSDNAMPVLLRGFDPTISDGYLDWVEGKKADLTATLSRSVLSLIASGRDQGNWTFVELQARALLRSSPGNEEATLALAEALAMRGEKLEGVRVLDHYLSEIGSAPGDLRLSATTMRRRIADRMPAQPDGSSPDIPLIGRTEQLAKLAHALKDAKSGHGSSCQIWGNPGIGKSRLLNEFLAFAALQGVASHRVQCRASDKTRSLAVLLDLIPLLRNMRGAIGSAPETLEFFDRLTRHNPKESKDSAFSGNSERTHFMLEHALSDTLDAVSDEVPLIIAIEDSHWLDPASAGVLSAITSRISTRRILMLFTSRNAPDANADYSGGGVGNVFVPPLSEVDAVNVVLATVHQRDHKITPPYLDWCVNVAEGNPYFLQELCNHWIETGKEYVAPPSLTALLQNRVLRLSTSAMQLLQACALLENHSTIANLEQALHHQPSELLASINELANAGMAATTTVTSRRGGGAIRLTSRHDLLSDIALLQLAPPARAYLHRRAAIVLEAQIGEDSEASVLWSCAKHWQLAGEGVNALRLAQSCAFHLLDAGLPTDALQAFDKAKSYCESEADLLAIAKGQVKAAYLCSAWQQVIDSESQARQLQRKLHPGSGDHDELELMSLRAEWQNLSWDLTLQKSLLCLAATSATPRHRVDAGVMALMLLSHSDPSGESTPTYEQILGLASESDVPKEFVLKAHMVFHTNWGSVDEAAEAARLLVIEDRKTGNIGELFRSLSNAAVTYRVAGKFNEAKESLQEALLLADKHHLHTAKLRVLPMLANLALDVSDTQTANFWHSQIRALPIADEDKLSRLENLTIGARLALLEGNTETAEELWQAASHLIGTDRIPQRTTYSTALQVAIEQRKYGKPSEESVALLEESYLRSRQALFQGFATCVLVLALTSLGRSSRAKQILRDYQAQYRRETWPLPSDLLQMLECSPNIDRRHLGVS